MRRRPRTTVAVAVWILGLASGPARAGQAHGDVYVIAASTTESPFPKELKRFQRQLRGGRFARFRGFRVLKRVQRDLVRGRPLVFVPADPYLLELTLLGRVGSGRTAQYRFRLALKIKRRGKLRTISRSTLRIAPGETFFLAGPPWRRATLILAITLK